MYIVPAKPFDIICLLQLLIVSGDILVGFIDRSTQEPTYRLLTNEQINKQANQSNNNLQAQLPRL